MWRLRLPRHRCSLGKAGPVGGWVVWGLLPGTSEGAGRGSLGLSSPDRSGALDGFLMELKLGQICFLTGVRWLPCWLEIQLRWI